MLQIHVHYRSHTGGTHSVSVENRIELWMESPTLWLTDINKYSSEKRVKNNGIELHISVSAFSANELLLKMMETIFILHPFTCAMCRFPPFFCCWSMHFRAISQSTTVEWLQKPFCWIPVTAVLNELCVCVCNNRAHVNRNTRTHTPCVFVLCTANERNDFSFFFFFISLSSVSSSTPRQQRIHTYTFTSQVPIQTFME